MDKEYRQILRNHTTSEIHVYHGSRRSGKTLTMTWKILRTLIRYYWINVMYAHIIGTKLLGAPLQVWGNYYVDTMYIPAQDGATWPGSEKAVHLETLPLDIHKLYAFAPEMAWGKVFVDELDKLADRQDWQNGGQQLLVQILTQVGKRHLSLDATVQSLAWINPRYMFQVDMTTLCRDASKTKFGKRRGIEPGDLTFTRTRDLSGGTVGKQYDESGEEFEKRMFLGKIKDFYDTDLEQDPFQRYNRFSVKRRKFVIDPYAQQEINQDLDTFQQDTEIMVAVVKDYAAKGNLKPKRPEFLNECHQRGMAMDDGEAIEYLKETHNIEQYGSMGVNHLDMSDIKNIYGLNIPKNAQKRVKREKKVAE